MKEQPQRLSLRERYRALVSLLIIPLGLIIVVRAAMFGLQAWTLIVLGLAFVVLGIVRLRGYVQVLLANAEGDHKAGQAQGPHPSAQPPPVPTFRMLRPSGRDQSSPYDTGPIRQQDHIQHSHTPGLTSSERKRA